MEYDFSESLDFVEEVVRGLDEPNPVIQATKSAQKLKFEAEVEAIGSQFGSIEDMRLRMGLSRRKMCEQLMVDPSAWTRWTQEGATVPPHVYKTMALLIVKFDSSPLIFTEDVKPVELETLNKLEAELSAALNQKIDSSKIENQSHLDSIRLSLTKLQSQFEKREVLSVGWKLLLILNFGLILYILIK